MTDEVLLDLQKPADMERLHVRGLFCEICPAFSQDAYQVVSVKAEVPSDAEAEEDPLAITSTEIKAESEVSCVSVSLLGGFHKYTYPLFYKHSIYELCYIEDRTFIRSKRLNTFQKIKVGGCGLNLLLPGLRIQDSSCEHGNALSIFIAEVISCNYTQ
jgi:hypothetical protein